MTHSIGSVVTRRCSATDMMDNTPEIVGSFRRRRCRCTVVTLVTGSYKAIQTELIGDRDGRFVLFEHVLDQRRRRSLGWTVGVMILVRVGRCDALFHKDEAFEMQQQMLGSVVRLYKKTGKASVSKFIANGGIDKGERQLTP